ncbi:hypothetical protein APT25_26555 [Escherichia coli]|nr:hypothetical protein APT25_26555 [Escherichia coli]HAH2767840.1 hypothetical protein [Escherichia coli]
MRLRRARQPQSYGKPHHCWAERRKPPESPLLKKTPKRRCYLIRLFVHCPITDRITMYIQHRRNSFLRISILQHT